MLKITQGDYVVLNFTAQNGTGTAHNLTGATFETKIMGSDGALDTFNNGHHAIVSAANGTFTLTLSESETALLKLGAREIVTKVTQGGHALHFHGKGALVVQPADPEA